MDITQTILYGGVSVVINSKKTFIRAIMQFDAVKKKLVELLLDEKFSSKLTLKRTKIGGAMQFPICDEDLEYIFDEMIGKKISPDIVEKLPEDEKDIGPLYLALFENNGQDLNIDVTNFITYAIVKNKKCVDLLYSELEGKNLFNEVLNAFEQSEYADENFEKNIDAKEIAPSRLMRGLIVQCRNQKSTELYQMCMRIISAGYAKKRRDLKKYKKVNSDAIKDLQKEMLGKAEKSVLLGAAEQIIIYILAEDMGIKIEWDFSMLSKVFLIAHYECELQGDISYVEDVPQIMSELQKEDKKKIAERNGTCHSIEELLYSQGQEEKHRYIASVMHSFGVSPRKFQAYSLTTREIMQLMAQKEKWSAKDYMCCMVIAIFCKYILSLEELISKTDVHEFYNNQCQLDKQFQIIQKKEEEIILEHEKFKEKEVIFNNSILEEKRQVSALQDKVEEMEKTISAYEQELSELRNYVYGLQNEWNQKEDIDINEEINYLKEKKIIVFGGHGNWQRKIRDKFPDWQFVGADIKSFSNDLIRDKEYIVFNTDFLSHASYYKVMACRSKLQKILFVHNNNADLCIKELNMQIHDKQLKVMA